MNQRADSWKKNLGAIVTKAPEKQTRLSFESHGQHNRNAHVMALTFSARQTGFARAGIRL
jgi:hypothetical protein